LEYIKDYDLFNYFVAGAQIIPIWVVLESLEALFEENNRKPLDKGYIIKELESMKLVDKAFIETSIPE